jgi:type IV secretion system protein VirB2
MSKQKLTQIALASFILLSTVNCLASGSGTPMPWEGALNNIMYSITGPVAKVLGVLAIALTGLALAFSEGGGLLKKLLNVVMGLSIAFSAASFGLDFFGFGSGCGF